VGTAELRCLLAGRSFRLRGGLALLSSDLARLVDNSHELLDHLALLFDGGLELGLMLALGTRACSGSLGLGGLLRGLLLLHHSP
jgi:hypothetical protein